MLKYSFNLQKESESIENAVKKALSKGYRTKDIAQKDCKLISTSEMGDVISGIIGVDL
jgi:3-isopropylmalate dehydrogenase